MHRNASISSSDSVVFENKTDSPDNDFQVPSSYRDLIQSIKTIGGRYGIRKFSALFAFGVLSLLPRLGLGQCKTPQTFRFEDDIDETNLLVTMHLDNIRDFQPYKEAFSDNRLVIAPKFFQTSARGEHYKFGTDDNAYPFPDYESGYYNFRNYQLDHYDEDIGGIGAEIRFSFPLNIACEMVGDFSTKLRALFNSSLALIACFQKVLLAHAASPNASSALYETDFGLYPLTSMAAIAHALVFTQYSFKLGYLLLPTDFPLMLIMERYSLVPDRIQAIEVIDTVESYPMVTIRFSSPDKVESRLTAQIRDTELGAMVYENILHCMASFLYHDNAYAPDPSWDAASGLYHYHFKVHIAEMLQVLHDVKEHPSYLNFKHVPGLKAFCDLAVLNQKLDVIGSGDGRVRGQYRLRRKDALIAAQVRAVKPCLDRESNTRSLEEMAWTVYITSRRMIKRLRQLSIQPIATHRYRCDKRTIIPIMEAYEETFLAKFSISSGKRLKIIGLWVLLLFFLTSELLYFSSIGLFKLSCLAYQLTPFSVASFLTGLTLLAGILLDAYCLINIHLSKPDKKTRFNDQMFSSLLSRVPSNSLRSVVSFAPNGLQSDERPLPVHISPQVT